MAPDHPARPLLDVLPVTPGPALPGGTALSRGALACAAAIAGSTPRVASFANLLPPERRASHNRVQYLVPAILGILLALAALTLFVVFPAIEQKRYREDLSRAARQLEPAALRVQTIERKINDERNRIISLDEIRRRPQADLEVLSELSRLLPPQVWTNAIEIYPDSVVITGEADQAAPLVKLLDSSPLFQNSEFALSVTRTAQTEQFRIKTTRRGRAGRSTP
jgi:Tfp pilus assembly protein PilN